jgi:signal transduction histidine kinase
VKYSDKDSLIQVNLEKRKWNVVITVKNPGKGISEEDLPNIFDRFYRADKSRNRSQESFGLGLAIVKALVEQEKGSIHCSSSPGEMTVFTLKLKL